MAIAVTLCLEPKSICGVDWNNGEPKLNDGFSKFLVLLWKCVWGSGKRQPCLLNKKVENSPEDILQSYFAQHTRPHSPWPPRSDVTEPDVGRSISLKSWPATVNRVFGLSQDLQRGSSLEKSTIYKPETEYCNTVFVSLACFELSSCS